MGDEPNCQACGIQLEADAGTEGLCPRCLLKLALPEGRPEGVVETASPPDSSDRAIGPYHLLEKVGEGGMGEVWEAEQREPVRRRVALKLIKAGMDTRQVVARFESERQALALMNHPAIARVFDAGETEAGRPYFVMELVSGLPITEYCDTECLSMSERLELFIQVCEGVQHAHQKGVIHRDIKPSNVLIQLRDGKPSPKIIDFGVAKATQQRLTEKTLFTQLGALVGTPAYMSPEQAEMSSLDIDTRSDVYSLGVLLYELLVGALPFDPQELRKAGFDEIRRVIREEDPPRPSHRLSTLSGDDSSDSARRRQTSPRSLSRDLRGDLDWITMRALEKNRARRYSSPFDLAEDIRRHLRHEPVLAGPPSGVYRAGRFIRRHRLGVSAAALVILALVLGLGAATWGLIQARRAKDEARREAQTAEEVSDFLVGLFEVSDPSESRGKTITAREILDRGVDRIGEQLADRPGLRSRMLGTMGRVYASLGLLADGERLLEEAARIEGGLPSAERLKRDTLQDLAWARLQLGRFEEAEQAYRDAIEERRSVLGENHPETASLMAALGNLYRNQSRLDEAEALLSKAAEVNRAQLGDDDEKTLTARGNLAVVYMDQGRFEEAVTVLEEVLAGMRRTLGDDHFLTLTVQRLTGYNLTNLGEYGEAERVLADCAATQRRVLGPDHPRLQETLHNLAGVYRSTGRYAEARRLYGDALRIGRQVRDDHHPLVIACLIGVGETFLQEGRYDEAEAPLSEAWTNGKAGLGRHAAVGVAASRLAQVRKANGQLAEAEALLDEALVILRSTRGETSDLAISSLVDLAAVKALRGDREGALRLLGEAVGLGLSPAKLADRSDFAPIRDDPRFLALVEPGTREHSEERIHAAN